MEHATGPTLLAFGGHVVFESIGICACSEEHAACKRAAQRACSFIGTGTKPSSSLAQSPSTPPLHFFEAVPSLLSLEIM
jgi:hypothetical protein